MDDAALTDELRAEFELAQLVLTLLKHLSHERRARVLRAALAQEVGERQ